MATSPVIRHVVSSTDTVESIAYQYLGSTDAWTTIVDFNNLDEPYLTNDDTYLSGTYASGLVLLSLPAPVPSNVSIPKGTQVAVPISGSMPVAKVYTVQADTVLATGQSSVLAFVQCTSAGDWGNIAANQISRVIPAQGVVTSPAVLTMRVTNPMPFVNGKSLNIKGPGDSLLIPMASPYEGVVLQTDSEEDYLAILCGTDLALTPTGAFMVDSSGDWATFRGLTNAQDAATTRLTTPYKELILHPEYGSGLQALIGEANSTIKLLLIGVEAQKALIQDDRFSKATVSAPQLQGNAVTIEPVVTLSTGQEVALGSVQVQ